MKTAAHPLDGAATARLFQDAKPSPKTVRERARDAKDRQPGHFGSVDGALRFFRNIRMPASGRWAFKSVDKAASSSALRFLFEMEFGVPLTVAHDSTTDINTDTIAHLSLGADLFRTPLEIADGTAQMAQALRLATVRDPGRRAVSSFLYICRTQDQRSGWMVQDRLRLSALTGFDWNRHPRTRDGFLRFLDYVDYAHTDAEGGGRPVNTHWMRQTWLIRPAIFKPDLLGRTEAMDLFYAEVADRLGRALPQGWTGPHTNAQDPEPGADLLTDGTVRRRIAGVYAQDFVEFDYDT